jgi:hypothetical protein
MKRPQKVDLAKFVGVARFTTMLVLCLSVPVPFLGAEHLDGRSAKVVGNEAPEQQAWDMLRTGIKEGNTGKRTDAVRALRLLPCNPEATEMALTALQDPKPQVRATAASVLGLMGCNQAISALKKALSDNKPVVVLAAAHSLQPSRLSGVLRDTHRRPQARRGACRATNGNSERSEKDD